MVREREVDNVCVREGDEYSEMGGGRGSEGGESERKRVREG